MSKAKTTKKVVSEQKKQKRQRQGERLKKKDAERMQAARQNSLLDAEQLLAQAVETTLPRMYDAALEDHVFIVFGPGVVDVTGKAVYTLREAALDMLREMHYDPALNTALDLESQAAAHRGENEVPCLALPSSGGAIILSVKPRGKGFVRGEK